MNWSPAIRSGYLWAALIKVVQFSGQFLVLAIVARRLTADEIGTFTFSLALVNILLAVNEVGLGGSVIQRNSMPRDSQSTLFWAGWFLALAQLALLQTGAGVWADFTETEMSEALVRWLSLIFPFSALGIIPGAILIRHLDFRRVAIQDISSALAAGGLALAMAVTGWGLWSLVAWSLTQAMGRSLLAFFLSGWRPRPVFRKKALQDSWAFGLNYAGTRLLSAATANLDYVIIGKLVSPVAVGVYTLAFNLSRVPSKLLPQVVSRVAFPIFSRMQEQPKHLREHYLLKLGLLSSLTLPLSLALLGLADLVVPLVYGPGWDDVVGLLRILAVTGTLAALVTLNGPALLSRGRAGTALLLNLGRCTLLTLAVIAGASLGGVQGAAWAVLVFSLTSFLLGQILVNHVIHINMRQVGTSMLPSLVAGAGMFAVFTASTGLFGDLPEGDSVVASSVSLLTALFTYLLLLLCWPRYRLMARMLGRPLRALK